MEHTLPSEALRLRHFALLSHAIVRKEPLVPDGVVDDVLTVDYVSEG